MELKWHRAFSLADSADLRALSAFVADFLSDSAFLAFSSGSNSRIFIFASLVLAVINSALGGVPGDAIQGPTMHERSWGKG